MARTVKHGNLYTGGSHKHIYLSAHPVPHPAYRCLLISAGGTAQEDGAARFRETGFCISGRIREFWELNSGLPVFGFSVTPQVRTRIEGLVVPVQWFERARLEVHAENIQPYDVQLGRLGAESLDLEIRNPEWSGFRPGRPQTGCRFFAETQHSVCGDFLKAWQAHGFEFDGHLGISAAESLALFGLPLTEPTRKMLHDGRTYLVQWFEHARFELHPENVSPYNVLLATCNKVPRRHNRTAHNRRSAPASGKGCGSKPKPPNIPDGPGKGRCPTS